MKFETGQLILYNDYYGERQFKTRPLFVYRQLTEVALIGATCTSHKRDYDDFSYYIDDWQTYGLIMPTSVRTNKIRFLNLGDVFLDADGEPIILGKLPDEKVQEICKLLDRYANQLTSISRELNEEGYTEKYAIREVEYVAGKAHYGKPVIYDSKDEADKAFKLCKSEYIYYYGKRALIDFELGSVPIVDDGKIDERNFKKIIAKTPREVKVERKR